MDAATGFFDQKILVASRDCHSRDQMPNLHQIEQTTGSN